MPPFVPKIFTSLLRSFTHHELPVVGTVTVVVVVVC
jgi:hypothetical protein